MYNLQLGDNLFVDINSGDIFVYRYSHNHFSIQQATANYHPPVNEYTIEIISFYSERHFIFKRDNGYYWWEEIQY